MPTRKAAGVPPITCPPYTYETFDPRWLEGHQFLYFDLHGLPGLDYWFEEMPGGIVPDRLKAITAEQIRSIDLAGAVVFATNCYLADDNSPMLDALLDAGVAFVVAGEGKNWSNTKSTSGASALGMFFREFLKQGNEPLDALRLAKRKLRDKVPLFKSKLQKIELADTLEFRAYWRDDEEV